MEKFLKIIHREKKDKRLYKNLFFQKYFTIPDPFFILVFTLK